MAEAEGMAASAMAAAAMSQDSNAPISEDQFNSTTALVQYLRTEADLAEGRARRLRQQAAALAQKYGISEAAQETYGKRVRTRCNLP